jgi:hypothetical protein
MTEATMAHPESQLPSDWNLLWTFLVARRRAVLGCILKLVLAAVAVVSFSFLLEIPFAPWARSLGMWPTLTGEWTGELETEDGQAQPMFLEIRGGVPRRGRPYIDGRARLCHGSGWIRDFGISGAPDNWRGTRFHLSARSLDENVSGLGPGEMQAEWLGDEIRATGVLVSLGPVATASASRSSRGEGPPPVRYALRRGNETDFLAACQPLTRPD